jgi:hypothetical protein
MRQRRGWTVEILLSRLPADRRIAVNLQSRWKRLRNGMHGITLAAADIKLVSFRIHHENRFISALAR